MDAVRNAKHCHTYPYFQRNAFPTGYINITQIWPGLWARQMLDQWKDKQIVDYEKIVENDAIKSGRDLGKRWTPPLLLCSDSSKTPPQAGVKG